MLQPTLAPIVVFGFQRPAHLRRCLESLAANPEAKYSKLYIYLDTAKPDADAQTKARVAETLAVAQERLWCGEVEIVQRSHNYGLAANIEEGVTQVVQAHGRVIVLEDDLVLSPAFLAYMNDGLRLYADVPEVMHVSGYMFPTKQKLPQSFFLNSASCWGWATWARAWQHYSSDLATMQQALLNQGLWDYFNLANIYEGQVVANLTGQRCTWAVKWQASMMLRGGYCLHPATSYVNNIGFGQMGENCKQTTNAYTHKALAKHHAPLARLPLQEDAQARQAVVTFHQKLLHAPSLGVRVRHKLGAIRKNIQQAVKP